jgi:THO complex subunit 2
MVDDSQQTLAQYLDFLRSNLDPAAFDVQVPSIDQLMTKYGLDISFAFLIGRASLSQKLMPKDDQSRSQPSQPTREDGGDVAMSDAPSAPQETKESEPEKPSPGKSDANGQLDGSQNGPSSSKVSRMNDPFLEILKPIIDSVEQKEDASFWKPITPEFYIVFWALQLSDIYVPEDKYEKEFEKAIKMGKELMHRGNASQSQYNAQRNLSLAIAEEKGKHKTAYSRNKLHMIRNFKSWFPDTKAKLETTADAILERCLVPRLALSASDAEYCYKMIRFLHDWGAPNFKLMTLYDQFFNANRLRGMIFT